MRVSKSAFVVPFLPLALIATLATSCARDPQVARRAYIAKGDAYAAKRNFGEAIIEYANAAQVDPKAGDAHLKLAEAYLADGNVKGAFPQFIRAADLLPDDIDVQFKAGFFLLKGGFFTEAKDRARAILQKEPANARALMLLANCLAGLHDVADAIDVLDREVTLDPESAGAYTTIGVLQLSKGDQTDAEAAFKKAIDVSKGSADAYLALGNFYHAVGDNAAAERALRHALVVRPGDVTANEALATLYVGWNRPADAETCLKAVIALRKEPRAQRALATLYASMGRTADAVATLDILAADPAQFAAAKTQTALIQFLSGEREQAEKSISAALEREPKNAAALTTKARLELAAGQREDALETVNAALQVDTQSPQANLTKGRTLVALGREDEAIAAFNATLSVEPKSLPAELELIDLHRRRGAIETALQFADQAVRDHPASLPVRLAMIRTLLVRDSDRPRALAELRALQVKHPASAAVQSATGAYSLSINDVPAAREAFQRALDLNPSYMEALAGLVAIDVAAGRPQDARARVDAVLVKTPDAPAALLLGAKVYAGTGSVDKSEAMLNRLIKLSPGDFEPYALLAQLYLAQGRLDDAKVQFVEMTRVNPRDVGPPTMLGVLCYTARDLDGARTWWQKALQIDPHAAIAANDLAWLIAETNGDLDKALDLARSARSQLPNQPEINDTLGWIYYRKKMSALAVEYLTQSTDLDGKNPMYQFHLGMSYALAGDDPKARRALQAALSLNPNFDGAAEAKRTLARLVY